MVQVKLRRTLRSKDRTPDQQYLPQQYGLVIGEEDRGTLKTSEKTGESQTNPLTFVAAGIDITSLSGSQSYPPASGEGPAAALRRLGNNQKERATRNPRINTH